MEVNETTCEDCGEGFWPIANRTVCYDLAKNHLRYMEWSSVYSIAPSCLAVFGMLLTFQVIGVFIRFNDTPVVKASGRELSYILLGGMIVCYLMTFVLLAKPGPFVCGMKRVGVGFGFAILYSAMLVKTNRIYRIFASAKESAQRPRWITPVSQCAITAGLVSLQLLGSLVWLISDPPTTRHQYPERDKVPENFNEAKFIGFTMYTTCVIWLAFVPIYFGTGSDFQIQTTTLCISISLSATVALFCLFSPKLWIILMEPEKNVRKQAAGKPMMSKCEATTDQEPSVYSPLLSSTTNPTSNKPLLNNQTEQSRPSEPSQNSLESLTSL